MIFNSFFARLSILFLVLILILGAASLVIAFNASRHLFDEVEQLLNREYAASIAREIQPLVEDGFSEDKIKEAIHYMMVLNPMVEIYLLDDSGKILAYFTHPDEKLIRDRVSLEPLITFTGNAGWEPILGDDPKTESTLKPFSAAELEMGLLTGYVYVILRGQSYDRSLAMISSNYYIRSGLFTFFIAVTVTLLIGLLLFFFLTRRLKILSSAVRAFEKGEYGSRVNIGGNDELSSLGGAFNEMAGSIEEGVRQLKLAERQRSDLIANISHDLRSPLTSIRGHLETILLKEDALSAEDRRQFIETSIRNVSTFQRLVEDLFELARFEAGQVKPERQHFSIAELTQDVVLKLASASSGRRISINFDPGETGIRMNADIGMIERLLTNIIMNAIAHTPDNGRITIGMTENNRYLEITVSDSGTGIPEEDLPHIFERFYRADKSRNRQTPGTGLGLAIAKEITELHSGTITAANSRDGGAVFYIRFPL